MVWSWNRLTERQIQKALAEGKLSKLDGEGKPLPDRTSDALIESGLAVGHRMMVEAGVRPPEFDLKEQLAAARRRYATLKDPAAKKEAMTQIADLEMRYEMARDARRAFFR